MALRAGTATWSGWRPVSPSNVGTVVPTRSRARKARLTVTSMRAATAGGKFGVSTKNMVWVPGGEFLMGSEEFYPEERPVHRVQVDGFWMDEHPVTVAEFRRFVKETGHLTVAEKAPDPAEYPDADPAQLVPGSLVFDKPPGPVRLDDIHNWWAWVHGADWRHPEGPRSTLHGR